MNDGNPDSGIEFDLSSLLSGSDVVELEFEDPPTSVLSAPEYHELKSRVVVVGSPRTDFRDSSMGSRTQLRRNLERQQVLEHEEREKQQAQARQSQQQSQTIAMPTSFHSTEVPPKVLQVKTRLQHPTQYHIKQKQQEAVKMFFKDSDDCHMPAHSMPNLALPSVDTQWISGSAPTDMEGATAGLEEEMGLLEEIILDHAVDFNHDNDLHSIEPSLTQMSSTLPQQSMYAQYSTLEVDTASATSSTSCPPVFQGDISPPTHMTEEEQRMWAKDRQKKDNHNMIERRRRFNINDRIKELGGLLPKSYDQDMRQNKGSILKASVEYIRRLKKEAEQARQIREEKIQVEKNLQKLQLKFTQLAAVMKQQGTSCWLDEASSEMMVAPSSIINMQQVGMQPPARPEEQLNPANTFAPSQSFATTTQVDFVEDSSPVSGDPMLTSAPVSPDNDDSMF